jgi:hypothetical protein
MLAKRGGNLAKPGGPQEAQSGVTKGAEKLGSVAATHPTVILTPGCVAQPMQAVFDSPVAAPPSQQLGG